MKTQPLQPARRCSRGAVFTAASLLALFSAWVPAHSETVHPKSIRAERELFITAPAVVDSEAARYPGAWSFGTLVQELAGDDAASECVAGWMRSWCQSELVNDQVVTPRLHFNELVIEPWQARDGYDRKSGEPWKPNLAHAPFRLLAIVNRMDLCAPDVAGTFKDVATVWQNHGREADFLRLTALLGLPTTDGRGYGGFSPGPPEDFGEGRLVFGATTADGQPLPGDWTVIFEYRLPAAENRALNEWAISWHSLAIFDVNDAQFPRALEQVTRMFTHRGKAGAGPVLAQLRTSEAAFGADREFRQFKFENGGFRLVPLTQTPTVAFSHKHGREHDALAGFLHERDPLIRSGIHELPLTLPTPRGSVPLLAATAIIPAKEPDFHWEIGPLVSHEARRIYSLNTCNGCHAGETGCRDGLHVHPRAAGAVARLSEFLRTDQQPLRVADPALPAEKVEFREMEDRAAIFAALLETKERDRLADLREVLRGRLRRAH